MNYISFTVYGRTLTRFTLLSKEEIVSLLNKNNLDFRDLIHTKCTLNQRALLSCKVLFVYPKSIRCKTKCRIRRYRTSNNLSANICYWRKANIIFFEEELMTFTKALN